MQITAKKTKTVVNITLSLDQAAAEDRLVGLNNRIRQLEAQQQHINMQLEPLKQERFQLETALNTTADDIVRTRVEAEKAAMTQEQQTTTPAVPPTL